MKADNIDKKKIILRKLISSGINITPTILDFVLTLDNPSEKINLIIRDTSFIPNFKSHITENILKKISNEEIKKAFKRKLFKQDSALPEKKTSLKREINQISLVNQFKDKKNLSSSTETLENLLGKESAAELEMEKPSTFDREEKPLEFIGKSKLKIKPIESTKTSLAFNPLAREYESQFKIIKDPTGKLHTNGDYNDFYELTLDKFNRLRKLMRQRLEVHSADNINNILRLSNKVEVSVIGLVNEIRKTKNGNYFLTIEDLTGLVNIIIRRDPDDDSNIKVAERTLSDQMVYIKGSYNPGEKGNSGIIYGNYITKINIPRDFELKKSLDPLSIVLISDTHIGSKEFEEKLWNRFIAFLNGKMGNKTQREQAGKIKYIIINGDLVDGIGVYPNQKSDLVISDIYKQYYKASEILSGIPDYIKIFYSSGNHEPVRNAIPRPAVAKKYAEELMNIGITCIGNPSLIQTHNVNTLIYHGDSILDLNMLIPGLEHNKPVETMKELMICRHLAPIYGKKTQIAPTIKDWLVIDKIPDIFHTGHIHINGMGYYNNVRLVNSGCFQGQTDFMNSLGIHPTPGILSIIDLDTLKGIQLDLKNNV